MFTVHTLSSQFIIRRPSILTKLEEANVYRWPKTRAGKWVINSEVVQIGLNPLPEALTESVEVTLHHKVVSCQFKNLRLGRISLCRWI